MHIQVRSAVLLSACLLPQALSAPNTFDFANFKKADIISKDVAIIGGGSAGTYSAISLKDKGKSVIVIEKKGRVGGNTETYIDPETGTPIDIGVLVWHNITVVRDYFKRFDIPLTIYGSDAAPPNNAYYDFRTGKLLNISLPSATDIGTAFAKYAQFLAQYPKLDNGLFLPNPVSEDLLAPFGEIAKKYDFEAALNTMFELDPAVGDMVTVPTVERIRTCGLSLVQQLSTGFFTTAHHNNSELYSKAQAELLDASSLFLNSEVVSAQRGDGKAGIRLIVNTPQGKKLICAKKLLITIPPKVDLLQPFDLSSQEKGVFSRFIDAGYYTSIVKNTGIPDDLSIFNYDQNTPYNFPNLPGPYNVQRTGVPGLKIAIYGTPRSEKTFPLSDDAVKADIIKGIKTLQKTNPDKFKQTEPEFVMYSAHTPFYLQASPEDIKNGFYDRLYALQGLRNTYWSGATFRAQDSSDIWRYSEEEVLPQLLKGL